MPDPVVLTGDVHRHWAADLRQDYWNHTDPIVDSELVATSVPTYTDAAPPSSAWLTDNPHIEYCRNKRGCVRVTATSAKVQADFRVVSSVPESDPAKVTIATDESFVVQPGKKGLQAA